MLEYAADWCKKHKLEMPSFAELARDKLKEGNQVMEVEQRVLDSQVRKILHSMDVHMGVDHGCCCLEFDGKCRVH